MVEDRGRTTMTATIVYPSQEVRDAVIKSGMEHGAPRTYDKLAEHLASIPLRSEKLPRLCRFHRP
jgi:hypothetical protein